jgi:hypothetical protein
MKRRAWIFLFLTGCGGSSAVTPNPPSGAHVYYLNFGGQALTSGPDNPVLNVSQSLSGSFTAPAYLTGDAQRATKIQAIVNEVKAILAPYDVAVVTQRPASGAYDMVVAGGTSQQMGFPTGLQGVAIPDCTGAALHHISLLFDVSTGHDAARQIVGALGIGHRVSASTAATDCMCIVDGSCTALPAACTIGGANTPVSPSASCETSGVSTMDVRQEFLAAFGPHP